MNLFFVLDYGFANGSGRMIVRIFLHGPKFCSISFNTATTWKCHFRKQLSALAFSVFFVYTFASGEDFEHVQASARLRYS